MALKIQTTGLEQYAPGGNATLKVMIIGGPGAGKTRESSYWPKPIYMNCEAGLSSIADRRMPFVNVNTSQDALDLLHELKMENRRPLADRRFRTVVVDTIDAFQRKIKDEWLLANPGAQSFRGFDAWGYLDTKMQMLLTRLLNLDMNVIVLCHYTDKTIKEGTGENATERQELQLQLSGAIKDSIFNDFDLVGWMGTYWEAVDGQRVEKRGLTFKRTPEKPFLKDRLHVTPAWMEVTFSEEDYAELFSAVIGRLDDLSETETIGEIASAVPDEQMPTGGVVGPQTGGALPPQPAREVPLDKLDRPTLQKMARDLGLSLPQNTVKSEYIAAIQVERANAPAGTDATAASSPTPPAQVVAPVSTPAPKPTPEPAAEPAGAVATDVAAAPAAPKPEPTTTRGGEDATDDRPLVLEDVSASAPATPTVDTSTGEIDGPMSEEQVTAALGGKVLSVDQAADNQAVSTPAPTPAPAATAATCEQCGKDLAGENADYVKLAFIKFRKRLCNADYLAAKAGR